MAIIHRTTLVPSKLELLTAWLPAQPWYRGTGLGPDLAKAGGFRLDDPRGAVGIEFMVATDSSGDGDRPVSYHVPLTYREAPLEGAEHALIGTAEHGVLGRRWIYDGTHDPVLVAQLFALLQGKAEPQAQSVSDTPDPSVTVSASAISGSAVIRSTAVLNGASATDLLIEAAPHGESLNPSAPRLTLRVVRVLESSPDAGAAGSGVTAGWILPDGATARGAFVVVHDTEPVPPR